MGENPGGGVRLAAGLGIVTLVLFATYSAVLSVLLPTVIARIDPAGKVAALALVTSVSFAATAISQPLIGAFSDRTRGRWGRRSPWMLGGAIAGGAAVAALGAADSVPLLVVLWAVGQFALNGTDIASTTFLVDRYPPARRARIAGVFGVAAVAGGGIGTVVAGRLVSTPFLASVTFATAVIVVVAAFVVLVREREPLEAAEPFSVRRFLAGFAIDPRRHRAFAWLFASRFAFGVAYQAIYGFLLFILTDHLGISERASAGLLGSVVLVGAGAVIVAIVGVAWASDRTGRRQPFLLGSGVIGAAAILLLLLVPEVWVVFAVAAALGAGLGAVIVAGTALASETMPDAARAAGRGLGVYNFGTNVAQAVGPLVGAVAIGHLGGYPALFVLAIVGMLAAAILVLPIRGNR